jgi:hypothetical protein
MRHRFSGPEFHARTHRRANVKPTATLLGSILLGTAAAVAPARAVAADGDVPTQSLGSQLADFGHDLSLSMTEPVKTLGLHAYSYHSKTFRRSYIDDDGRRRTRDKFNNATSGVYVINEDGWGAGIYHNSLRRITAYGGRFLNVWGPLDVAVGVATGYNETIVPMIVPTLHHGPARLWVQPAIGGPNNTTMVHLSLEFDR